MFFGQQVKNNQAKASLTTLDMDIKISQAVLDPATKGNKKEPVCLMAEVEGKSCLLAVLDPSQSYNCPLDLMLAAGTKVKFYLKGQGTIHLTGYEFRDEDEDFDLSMSSDEEMEELENGRSSMEHKAKKIKTKNSPATNGVKKVQPAAKMRASGDNNDSNDESSDDEDLSFGSDDGDSSSLSSEAGGSSMDDIELDAMSSDDQLDEDDDVDDDDDDDDEEESD